MSYGMFIKAKKSVTNRKSPVSLVFRKDVLLLNCISNVVTVIVFTGCTTYQKDSVVSTLKPRQNGRYLVDDIFKMTFLMKIIAFWFKFHRIFSAIVQFTISQSNRRQANICTNDGVGYQCIYSSLGCNELIKYSLNKVRPRKNIRHFEDEISKFSFIAWISYYD